MTLNSKIVEVEVCDLKCDLNPAHAVTFVVKTTLFLAAICFGCSGVMEVSLTTAAQRPGLLFLLLLRFFSNKIVVRQEDDATELQLGWRIQDRKVDTSPLMGPIGRLLRPTWWAIILPRVKHKGSARVLFHLWASKRACPTSS